MGGPTGDRTYIASTIICCGPQRQCFVTGPATEACAEGWRFDLT